jgi:hypothetical protein
MKRKNQRLEHALQRSVARYLELALRPPTIWTAMDAWVGNVGAKVGGERKARGIKAGWPDLLVFHENTTPEAGGMYGVAIELKTDNGDQSDTQEDFQKAWNAAGGWYFVCRSIDDVRADLLSVGVIPIFDRSLGVQK